MTTNHHTTSQLDKVYRDLALTIAAQATAIAEGTVTGPRWAAVRQLRHNAETLEAWTEDDRS